MALSDGTIERWSLADVLAIKPNLENRTLNFSGNYLHGEWNDSLGDPFEVCLLDNEFILVDGHHRQHALANGWLDNLPDTFAVWHREAETMDDIRARQDAHMEGKRTPNATQRASIIDKRLSLTDLESKQAKRIGITAVKQLGYKGKDALLKGKTDYIEEIRLIDTWGLTFEAARYPQGILAAMLKTARISPAQACDFWHKYDAKARGSKFIKRVLDRVEQGGIGEEYNAQLYATSVDSFDYWMD